MKKLVKIVLGLFLVFTIVSPTTISASEKSSFSLKANPTSVQPGASFDVTLSVADLSGRIDISVSNGTTSTTKLFPDSITSPNVTFSVTAGNSGNVVVTAKAIDVSDDAGNLVENLSNKSVTVTIKQPEYNPKLSPTSKTLEVGESVTLKVTDNHGAVNWSSSDSSVASVSNGTVTALKKGTATITANVDGKNLTCKITVTQKEPKISEISKKIEEGKSFTLKVTDNKGAVNWSSSDSSVATVSNGKVTAKKPGSATITASVDGYTLTCKVTVTEKVAKISATSKTLEIGETYELKVADNKGKVTWSSSDDSVASVDTNGKVTALKAGTATITASVDGKKLTCKITVKQKEPKISATEKTLTVGGEFTLEVKDNTGEVVWSSSNEQIASVDTTGKVKAVAEGTATITAKVDGKELTCKVTVEPIVLDPAISEANKSIYVGDTFTLQALNVSGDVVWTSSDESIVKVDADGNVTGIAEGEATVIATVGDVELKCEVTVKEKVCFYHYITLMIVSLAVAGTLLLKDKAKLVFIIDIIASIAILVIGLMGLCHLEWIIGVVGLAVINVLNMLFGTKLDIK